MAWFVRSEKNIAETSPAYMPDGLWTKCPSCGQMLYKKQLEENYFTCNKCGYHFRISSNDYIEILIDKDTFKETNTNIRSTDPLGFIDTKPYADRIKETIAKTGLNDAITTGIGKINGKEISIGVMNFNFIGGSMGSVVGEKIYRAAKYSLEKKEPLIIVSVSGGARMQESALSLMQMPKTAAILAELHTGHIPYISILTDPTTGGVSASYSMLGDINIAEPGALIGFAGPRVIEQTIRKKLPPNFQRAETVLETGFVDMIVPRTHLRETIIKVINWFNG
ncbi:MAG TPA: acetyl-CoA carboxylase, carboxyltransferase subunit beta [Candidatus Kapabacteria bacterium]|jgi:acetyl-CoA carboxylase carboxyl transferase subunit beta|nr:acetyl-CoA carboxylase, carboxyltransferase subunit beta [Candidatus Kapabacteria bacterium]